MHLAVQCLGTIKSDFNIRCKLCDAIRNAVIVNMQHTCLYYFHSYAKLYSAIRANAALDSF